MMSALQQQQKVNSKKRHTKAQNSEENALTVGAVLASGRWHLHKGVRDSGVVAPCEHAHACRAKREWKQTTHANDDSRATSLVVFFSLHRS